MSNIDETDKVYDATGGVGGIVNPDISIYSSAIVYDFDPLFKHLCAAIRKDLDYSNEEYTIEGLYNKLYAMPNTIFNTSIGKVTRTSKPIGDLGEVEYISEVAPHTISCIITNTKISVNNTSYTTNIPVLVFDIEWKNNMNEVYTNTNISYDYIKKLSNTIPLNGLHFYFGGIYPNKESHPTQAVKILRQLSGLYTLPTYPLCTVIDLINAMDNPDMIKKITYLPKPGYFTESCELEGVRSEYSWIPLLLYRWMPIIVRYEPDIKNTSSDDTTTKAVNAKLLEVYTKSCGDYKYIIWHMKKSDTLYIPNVIIISTS